MFFVAAGYCANDALLLSDSIDGDVHTSTARMLFGTLAPVGTDRFKLQRQCGKTFNLATLYGAQERKLQSGLEKDTGEAWPVKRLAEALDWLRGRYANLNAWRMLVIRQAGDGIPQTDPWGRRYLPDRRRAFAMINWIVQGFSAGVMKRAALRLIENGFDLRMLIHDEALIMVPTDEVDRRVPQVLKIMSGIEGYNFPVDANVAWDNYDAKRGWKPPEVTT